MEEALAAVFPQTTLRTCIVHLLRQSLDFANWKQRKPLATAWRTIHAAPSAELALGALDAFERGEWGQRFPTVAAWRRARSQDIPFFAFPPEIRRVIYTTNALESVHASPRKICLFDPKEELLDLQNSLFTDPPDLRLPTLQIFTTSTGAACRRAIERGT